MTSKASLSVADWELVKDSPDWVYAALAAADGTAALTTKFKESRGFSKALDNFKTKNQLIEDVIADNSKPAKAISGATLSDAEEALKKIGAILDKSLSPQEADEFRDFLLKVGETVAEAAGEKILGIGENVSKKEASALDKIKAALKSTAVSQGSKATPAKATEGKSGAEAKAKEDAKAAQVKAAQEQAKANRLKAAKAKEEEAKKEAEAKIKVNADRVKAAQAKAAAEKQEAEAKAAEAKREAEAKAAAEKQEAEAKAAEAKREAEAKAAEAKREAEAKAAAAKRAAEAAAATKYIAEHTVVSGDSLSAIALSYYGSAAKDKWMLIYEENKAVIGDNPNLIRVGQVLKIPKAS